mgnify:CR=1 FL=1
MEILNENLNPSIERIITAGIEILKKKGRDVLNDIKKEYLPLVDVFIKNMTGEIKDKAFGKEVDILDIATLVNFAKKYLVNGSNEIVAIRKKETDCCFIYLAYSHDRELIDVEKNNFLVIKANSLADDVNSLFEESELIILK